MPYLTEKTEKKDKKQTLDNDDEERTKKDERRKTTWIRGQMRLGSIKTEEDKIIKTKRRHLKKKETIRSK